MVMRDQPFIVVLNEKYGEARWCRHGLAFFNPGKLVKAGNDYSVIA